MQRRSFLHSLAAGSLLIPLGPHAWAAAAPDDGKAAATNGADPASKKKLIVILLRGAVDGLNVVVPYGDANYARLRPSIGLSRPGSDQGALALDGFFGLHPNLVDLMPFWQQKKLAFIHGCGSPDPTRSHFDAQDFMESGTPGVKSTQDGWMNRLLAQLPGPASPTRALSIGPVMPRILSGSAASTTLAAGAAGTRANLLDKPVIGNAFAELYKNDAKLGRAFEDGQTSHQDVMNAANSTDMQADFGAALPNGFPDDASRLAKLMKNEPRIQMAFLALGGWDTHANQGTAQGQLGNRLAPLGQGLGILARQLGPLLQDTTIVVMSEFGRTAKQNGNGGTDHGHGNVMWLLGGGVQGGKVHGAWPGLDAGQLYEGRDLAVTTDFRSVLAQVARSHMGVAEAQVGKVFPNLPGSGTLRLFA